MINYLKGILVSKVEDGPSGCNITVDVNNIGYLVITNARTVSILPEEGETATVYTSLIHREDSMTLVGFNSREERDLFNILGSVSGIGTKAALAIMDVLGAYELVNAVISDNDKAISKAKGVGPKLAKKVILELKEKMTKWRDKVSLQTMEREETLDIEITDSYLEAETVLLSLGYTKKEVTEAMKVSVPRVDNKDDAEELLRCALQILAAVED